ncbi:hypothetical protein [Rhizobium leguminosarum]|uniref:hypothetical protein n=1 Tax=Rhizobium leguminosarum TaxID=384 RepID=UPI002E0E9486|nr:hypothetical protein U8Q02_41315 [Rhizobium leguminosarum]
MNLHPAPDVGIFGLRNRNTGLVVRVETVNGGIYGPKHALTYDRGRPFWKTDDIQGLIMTALEDRPRYNAFPETPTWNGVDVRECDPVRFFEHCEYGPDGGDPVAVMQFMKTFDFEVLDMRDARYQTADVMKVHYGAMQTIFRLYDMDKVDTMALAIVGFFPEVGVTDDLGLVGDIGITETRGPCRIVEVARLPDEWELNSAQEVERAEGMEHLLVLLDMADIAAWFDYDSIDCARAPDANPEEAEATEFRP